MSVTDRRHYWTYYIIDTVVTGEQHVAPEWAFVAERIFSREFYERSHLTLLANRRYCSNVDLSAAGDISDLSRRNDVLNKTNKSRSQWSESSDQSNSQKTFRAGNTATKWPIVQIERNTGLEVPELSLSAICLSKYFCSLEALSAQNTQLRQLCVAHGCQRDMWRSCLLTFTLSYRTGTQRDTDGERDCHIEPGLSGTQTASKTVIQNWDSAGHRRRERLSYRTGT
jgi:hypothetical protein